jgi:hypothetical protein
MFLFLYPKPTSDVAENTEEIRDADPMDSAAKDIWRRFFFAEHSRRWCDKINRKHQPIPFAAAVKVPFVVSPLCRRRVRHCLRRARALYKILC